jgi:hypothetical protein
VAATAIEGRYLRMTQETKGHRPFKVDFRVQVAVAALFTVMTIELATRLLLSWLLPLVSHIQLWVSTKSTECFLLE